MLSHEPAPPLYDLGPEEEIFNNVKTEGSLPLRPGVKDSDQELSELLLVSPRSENLDE